MSEIKVYFYYQNEIYRPNGDFFDSATLHWYIQRVQKQYEKFADKINAEGAHLEVHLSHPNEEDLKQISFDQRFANMSDELYEEIRQSGAFL